MRETEARKNLEQKKQLENIKPLNKTEALDIERHRAKMQRRCKHIFNSTTGKCGCCGKNRSAHI